MKKLLLKSMLLLCALIVGSGNLWADVVSGTTYNTGTLPTGWSGDGTSGSYYLLSYSTNYIQTSEFAQNGFTSIKLNARTYGGPTDAQKLITVSWYDSSTSAETVLGTISPTSKNLADYTIDSPTNPTANTTGYIKIQCKGAGSNKGSGIAQVTITYTAPVAAVATPTFSLTAGIYTSAQNVTLACETTGATIRYTTDGSTPTSSSTIFSTEAPVTPIAVTSTTTIRAKAFKGSDESNLAEATYTILPVTHAGTALDPYTVSDARNALTADVIDSEADYYVTGYITKKNDISGSSLTYWLSDDGQMTNTIQCFNGKYINGVDFTVSNDLEIDDIATVKGRLTIYGSSSTYRFSANNEVVSITPRTKVNIATFTATTNPLVLGETDETETTVTNDQTGWTPVSYTYTSDDEAVATVDASGVVTAVAKGTANITVTPNVSATDPTYKVGNSKSIEITVSNPSHTATFSVNGVTSNISVEEGDAISFPADPADIGGKKFVGWVEATIDGTTETAPTFVESATMSTGNVTYYAVFASSSTATVTKTDDITLSMTGVSGNSYSAWSNKQASGGSNAIYAGCNAGGNSAIQLNGSTSTSKRGIISTTTGGKLKKITVTWNSNSNNSRSLVVYGSTSAYESVSGFNESMGTELGSILKSSGTELTITGNYTYVGLYATAAIYMDEISIEWETTGTVYSGYCTSIPSSVPVTIASTSGFATLYSGYALDFSGLSSELKAYTATVSENTVTLTEVDDIPANTGVVLKGIKNDYEIPVAASSSTAKGDLMGNTAAATAYNAYDGYDLYMLALNGEGKAQFTKVTSGSIVAGKSFLKLSSSATARELNVVFADDDVTGVNTVNVERGAVNEDFFDLQGRKVAQPTKGLYIVNGRKVIVK